MAKHPLTKHFAVQLPCGGFFGPSGPTIGVCAFWYGAKRAARIAKALGGAAVQVPDNVFKNDSPWM